MTFPNPCPVCGATDEHAAWAEGVTGSPCTFCPHPGERGHGTGCCCGGRSEPFGLRAFGAPLLTAEQEAHLKRDFDETMRGPFTHRVMPQPPPVPGFRAGDKVWPREGPMVLQRAPQTVIGTYKHPVAGDWLWLDDGKCGFGSWAAVNWTTDEPDEAEKAAREERAMQRAAALAALRDGTGSRGLDLLMNEPRGPSDRS